MSHYISWDYEKRVAIEYERDGECNGCGSCCMSLIHIATSGEDGGNSKNGGSATNAEGKWHEFEHEGKRRFFQFPQNDDTNKYTVCPALSAVSKRCMVHNQKRVICSGFPFAPENITPFPDCSYSFQETRRWEFE